MTSQNNLVHRTAFNLTVLITGLGFFIDSYDFFLYNSMRVVSLTELGLSGEALTRTGIFILNLQILGALVGSIVFGIYGDKFGRKRGLLGSILAYSIGMFGSAFCNDPNTLAAMRFLTGFGAAGEVGLGATLVCETVMSSRRTFALAYFTLMGAVGVTTAALSLEVANWRWCCLFGGIGGLLLLLFRVRLFESGYFTSTTVKREKRGSIRELLFEWKNLKKFIYCTAILVPNYFITGILLTLSPEIAKATGVGGVVKANLALAVYFLVATVGDVLGAALSERLSSRKKVAGFFIILNVVLGMTLLNIENLSSLQFYCLCAALGLCNLWAISGTIVVEQFGTPLRALASTTSLNFARGMVIVMNLTFLNFKQLGATNTLISIGIAVSTFGLFACFQLEETYGNELLEE